MSDTATTIADVVADSPTKHHLFKRTIARRAQIMDLLSDGTPRSCVWLGRKLGCSSQAVYTTAVVMEADGLLFRQQKRARSLKFYREPVPPPGQDPLPLDPPTDTVGPPTNGYGLTRTEIDKILQGVTVEPPPSGPAETDDEAIARLSAYVQAFREQHQRLILKVSVRIERDLLV